MRIEIPFATVIILHRWSGKGHCFAAGDRVRIELLVVAYVVAGIAIPGHAQDISALQAAVQNRACPASLASVHHLDATAQCDPGGKAGAACDQQNNAPSPAWQQCHIEILKCRQAIGQKNKVIDDYNHLVAECRSSGNEAKSSAANSSKPVPKPPDQPQRSDQTKRQREAREAAEQAEAARQLEQQRPDQAAGDAAGRICVTDTGGYLVDTYTKKSPAWGVCQDLCTHTPMDGLPPPVDQGLNGGKRERYCEQQCQLTEVSEARCYKIKPDRRATVLQALRQDWEVHDESQFLPND